MRKRGRPVLGAICGLFLGVAIALDLLIFEIRPLDTVSIVVLPAAGLILGIILGLAAPLGRKKTAAPPSPPGAPAENPSE